MFQKYRNLFIASAIGVVILIIIAALTITSETNSKNEAIRYAEKDLKSNETANYSLSSGTTPETANAPTLTETTKLEDAASLTKGKTVSVGFTDRKIIMTGNMVMETNKFDNAVKSISQDIQKVGGYVEGSEITGVQSENGSYLENRTATYILRIPSKKFEGFMNQIGSIGIVTSKHTGGQDVTSEYIDTEARLKSMKIKENRLNAILKKADKLADVLAIETELENTRFEIESLTSSLKKWDNLVSYSTLTLSLKEVTVAKVLEKKPATMTDRLSSAFNNSIGLLTDMTKGLLIALVAFLPFAFILTVVFIIVFYIVSKMRKKNSNQ